MKVKKWYDHKPKQNVVVPLLRSLYDMAAEMGQILALLKDNPGLDIKPQIASWEDKLNSDLIKQSIKEVHYYASRERLQISGRETKKIKGSKTKTETKNRTQIKSQKEKVK